MLFKPTHQMSLKQLILFVRFPPQKKNKKILFLLKLTALQTSKQLILFLQFSIKIKIKIKLFLFKLISALLISNTKLYIVYNAIMSI